MPKPGPVTSDQLTRFGRDWKQGMHVLVTGPTGSGKTALGRYVLEQRIKRGGYVCVFVGKIGRDPTILKEYSRKDGWVVWRKWQRPKITDRKVLLWPNIDKLKTVPQKRILQRDVFEDAFDRLSSIGNWTAQIDEGLYTTSPTFLNLGNHLAMLHQMGRSSNLTLVTLAQRPSHLPIVIYGSASHAFIGQASEPSDRKRMAELGANETAKELSERIRKLTRHQFLWVPVVTGDPPETVDLIR